jgi:hypothetical protein
MSWFHYFYFIFNLSSSFFQEHEERVTKRDAAMKTFASRHGIQGNEGLSCFTPCLAAVNRITYSLTSFFFFFRHFFFLFCVFVWNRPANFFALLGGRHWQV